ncbi:putative adenylate/guanylate cyclase [Chloroherpeton thalassium ATCC 35110]|uniref:Putative adenylate/guanylate cyclase n=1 Tax=Chloroherpeton thalassium (strain ATCC 35110 / GB-78) TaxID=517418 RepID=B3QYN4_CHLT3|nr:adenylate/guanylate cyclase domain-containing protein [Chloroherpeton thalassium]ACF15107.1 putative adenylate/guanylate cyclase [Chloroherpeton thalassium ATCC 35110]
MNIQTSRRSILAITYCWAIAAIFIGLHDFLCAYSINAFPLENPVMFFGAYVALGTLSGAVSGFFLLIFLQEPFRRKSFLAALFGQTGFCTLLLMLLYAFGVWLQASVFFGESLFAKEVLARFFAEILNAKFLRAAIFGGGLSGLTSFFLQLSEKYGQGVLWDFIRGKFYTPKEQEKIFMFLDVKSSTSMAQQIGYSTYFYLLSDFFQDLTKPIIESSGCIYQCVGDELVITWETSVGLKEARAVRCFFEMERRIEAKSAAYLEKYGVVPSFKAGMHFGSVVTGEIGVLKKDIAHLGQAITIAARIQGVCNSFNEKLLLSEELFNAISLPSNLETKAIGGVLLKGKSEPITLFAVKKKDE